MTSRLLAAMTGVLMLLSAGSARAGAEAPGVRISVAAWRVSVADLDATLRRIGVPSTPGTAFADATLTADQLMLLRSAFLDLQAATKAELVAHPQVLARPGERAEVRTRGGNPPETLRLGLTGTPKDGVIEMDVAASLRASGVASGASCARTSPCALAVPAGEGTVVLFLVEAGLQEQ